MDGSGERFENNFLSCLDKNKEASFSSLKVTRDVSIAIQEKTVTQSQNSMWYWIRNKQITLVS